MPVVWILLDREARDNRDADQTQICDSEAHRWRLLDWAVSTRDNPGQIFADALSHRDNGYVHFCHLQVPGSAPFVTYDRHHLCRVEDLLIYLDRRSSFRPIQQQADRPGVGQLKFDRVPPNVHF